MIHLNNFCLCKNSRKIIGLVEKTYWKVALVDFPLRMAPLANFPPNNVRRENHKRLFVLGTLRWSAEIRQLTVRCHAKSGSAQVFPQPKRLARFVIYTPFTVRLKRTGRARKFVLAPFNQKFRGGGWGWWEGIYEKAELLGMLLAKTVSNSELVWTYVLFKENLLFWRPCLTDYFLKLNKFMSNILVVLFGVTD